MKQFWLFHLFVNTQRYPNSECCDSQKVREDFLIQIFIYLFQVHRISQLMNDNSEVKRQNVQHIPVTCESPLDKRLSSMPAEDVEHQNMSYSGR